MASLHTKIITEEGEVFVKRRDKVKRTLGTLCNYMEDFPYISIQIAIPKEQWLLMEQYIKYLEIPEKKKDLVKIAQAAAYLEPLGEFKTLLERKLKEAVHNKGIILA